MHELAESAYLSRFLFSRLHAVAPHCVPGGVRMVSIHNRETSKASRPGNRTSPAPVLCRADTLGDGFSPWETVIPRSLPRMARRISLWDLLHPFKYRSSPRPGEEATGPGREVLPGSGYPGGDFGRACPGPDRRRALGPTADVFPHRTRGRKGGQVEQKPTAITWTGAGATLPLDALSVVY